MIYTYIFIKLQLPRFEFENGILAKISALLDLHLCRDSSDIADHFLCLRKLDAVGDVFIDEGFQLIDWEFKQCLLLRCEFTHFVLFVFLIKLKSKIY